MKKNGLQIVSLLLSVVLLVLLFRQNQTIEELRNLLQNVENRMYDLEDDVRGISGDVTRAMEEAANPILNWEVQPAGIDTENQWLLANVVLELKTWQEDTTVNLETVVGADKHILVLPVNRAGTCSGVMQVPVNEQCEVRLAAVITSGGESQRVDLGGWGDSSMLLPLRLSGWGKAGTQTYENGVLTLAHDYSCSLEDWDNHNVPVNDPAFRFYCNDVKVTERPATLSTEGLQAGIYDYGNGGWPDVFPCEIGDTMRITFVCTDDYGLTYEFTIERWTVSEGDTTEEVQVDSDNYPELSWK